MPQYEVSVPGKGTFSVSSPTELTDQQVWLAVQRQLSAPESAPVPSAPPEGGFFPAVKRGFLQTGMLLGDVLPAMVGKAVGAEDYAKKQWEEAAETQKRIEREVPAAVPSYKDISSFGDAWVYAKEAVGESLASIIPTLLTGGAGAVLARPAVAAANTAAREAAEKTLMSAAIKMGPPTEVALNEAKKAAVQAGIDAAKKTALRYEIAGGFAGSALQNIPEVYQNIKEETGKEDIPAALVAGGFNAALDSVLPIQILKKIRGQGLSEKEVMAAWYKRGAKGLGKGFLVEGATEAAQEGSSILAENFVAENSDVFNAKNLERVINAGLKGGLGGGVITAATDIATGKAPPPEQTDRQRIEQLQREILGDVQTARSEKALEEAENAKKAAEDAEAARKEAERAPTVPELITIAQGQNAYSALEAEKQRLLGQEKKTKEVKEAIEVIKELQGRLVIEDVTRRAPSVPAEMDDKTIRSLGFVKSENPESVYQQLLGKSTRDPDVTAFLKNYAEAKAKPQTKDRINTFLGRVERAQIPLTAEEIAEGERRAREAVTEPSGAGPSVVGEPGAGAPAAGVGVTQPSGVVPPVTPVGEPPAGEGAAPAPVAPPPVTPPAPPVAPAAPPVAPPVAQTSAKLLISLPPRLQNITPAERDLYNFNQSLVEAQTPITGFDFERISDAPSPDGRGMTPESLVLSLEGTLGAVKDLDGKLRSKNRTGATVSQLIDQWKTASQIQARINQSKQDNPELWSNYATRQKELGGLKVGDLIQIETGEIGKLDAKFPKNWRIVFDESTPGILAGTKLLRPKEALRPAPAPPSAPAEAAIAASKAPSERQERIAFGKAIGAAQQYPGTLTARVNIPAQTAVTQNDFPGVVAALQKSKSPVVAEVANRARGLNTNIVIDEEAAETYAGKSPVMQQLSIDGAKMHIDALEKIRRLASQVDALPNGAVLPYSIIGETIPGIENGEQVGNISLEKLAGMGTTMFAQFPGFKLRTKEDFKALQKAFEDTTSDLGENKIRMTSTGSAETIGVSGVYDANTNTIRVPSYFAKNEGVLAHEIVHAQTVQAVANPNLRQKPVVSRLNKLYDHVKAELEAKAKAEDSAPPYGVASIQEFIAEGMSNPRFQFQLSKIKYQNTTAWDAFVEVIANLLGLKKDTAFTELLAIYSELMPPSASDVADIASAPAAAPAPTAAPAAPTTITAEQLINLGVKKTQPMIRRIAGKNMGIQADRARVLAELNKYINNKENSSESRENLAKLRDQFEEVGKTVTVAPTKKRKPQQTVMESAMLGRINMVGGLDLSLLSEFSEKKEIGVLGKDDRPLTRWINPMTDKGKLFRSGGMQDYGEIARVLEEAGYMEPGTVERDPTEAGERAKRMILSALKKEDAGQTISEMEEEARRRTEELSKMDQEAFDAENKAEFEAERQAIAEAEGLTLADLDVLEDNIPFLTDAVEQTPERLAADMRAMGFTEEEISDAVTEFSRKAVAAQAPEARAEEATQAPAAPKAAEELELEAPTAEELAAREKREADAREAEREEQKRLERKQKADAERDEFVLTGSDRPADVAAAAGQMSIFGKSSLPEVAPPKPVKLSKETQAKIDELSKLMQKMLGKMGLKNVALNLAQDLERNGEYANRLITLALDATNPVRDLRHESLHAMKELGFFSDAQWATLTKMARDKWIDKYLKKRASVYEGQPMSRYDAYMRLYNGNEDLIIEEAIADAFGDFDATKAPPGLMQAILFRMREFFRNIKEAMGMANIDSAEDIFRRVEKGELKETAPAVEAPARPSLRAPETEAFKRWFGDSKVVDAEGKPLVVYHGTGADIAVFDPSKQDPRDAGFWFANAPVYANQYAAGRKGGNVMPVYLSLKNPKIYYDRTTPITPKLIENLKAQGHDGIIRDFTAGPEAWRYAEGQREYAVFQPEQIKSATGNIGTYDITKPDIRASLRDATEDDRRRSLNDKRVSPRLPTAVKATEDPLGKVRLQPDLETFKRDPAAFRHNIGLMSKYPNFANVKGTPDQRAEQMIEHMKDNLLWLFGQWDANLRNRSKLWYVGGNRISHRWAEKYGIPPEQAAAIIASLSPQKDWFQNVSLAERTLDALVFNADTVWTPEMTQVFRERAWAKKFPLRKFQGKTLKDMYVPGDAKSLVNMAVWIRAWDEATNPQTARVITPEGNFSEEVALGKTGKPIALRAQSFAAMVKTLQIMQQPDLKAVSELIGKNHKVRSFYNNIIAPYAGEDVTIDTHAVAAALMRPLGSSDLEVYHNFGSAKPAKKDKEGNILVPASPGTKNSAVTGLYGTYAMYAEAYRRAAKEAGVLPREMQSITWEAIRGLFRPEQKQARLKQQINILWNKVSRGEISGNEARKQILGMVSGITDPAWAKSPAGTNESRTDSSYATELPRTGVPGGRPAEPTGRTGERVAGAVPRASLRDVPSASGMAYHAGNLGYGSDTTLGKMTGGRGTGHFGTGVYFVGSEDKTKSLAKTYDRPIQKVSLEGFKLARPGSVGAQQLHDGLKIVNNLVGNEPNTEDESKKIDDAAFKIWVSGVSRGASQEDIQKIIRQALAETRPLYDDLYATSTYVDSASTRVMKSLGYEGIDVRGLKDFDNTSFGTVVYTKKFEERPQVKPSLRDVPRANLRDQLNITTLQRIEQTTVAREEKGFVQRITEAISPKNFGFFRQQALNRYEGLSRADRMKIEQMGGVDLLADAGAESAALLSDMGAGVTASALGVHDRKGGAPVYNHYFVVEVNNRALAKRYTSKAQAQAAASAVNGVVRERGYVTVSNFNDSVKGPVLIFAPLMEKYKDPMIFQAFQFYSAAKRGARFMYTLDAKGNVIEKLFTADDINIELPRLEAQFPEFKTVHAEWIKYNDKLVDYMRDTGVISEQNAQTFKMHGDYFPFYRQIDGQDDALGPRIFQSISAVKPPKKLKGSELALGDFLENIVRNTQSAVQAGVKNVAARRAAQVGMDVGIVSEIAPGVTPESANSFYVLENGLKKYYDTRDQLFIESIKSLNLPDMPFIGMLAGPANLLRNLVTKDPGFILANLMRDSLSAWTTSGVKMTPIVDTMRNFGKALVTQNSEYKALLNAGVIGGYEFSQNIQTSGEEFGAAIRKAAGVPTLGEKIARPVTSVWQALEKATTASDAATRMEIYKRTLAETGNEAEAIFRALEVMNFNRKGSSAVIRILTAAVPFLNARMQGLDILYRAAIAPTVRGDTSERARQVQKTFFVRGAYLMALSAMYWLLTHDDEEYKKQEQETRDNYWLLPSLGVKIPIPFEVGVLFKVIPERILAYTFGDDTGRDFLQSMKRQLLSTLAFNPIPQTVLPLVETVTNFSFFTWRPIIPQGLENVAPEYQVGPGTSKLAEGIGKTLNLSPMRIDQLINGYTGTMGMYAVDLMDAIYNTMTDSPKPSKRFEQMPVIRRFAVDPEARGTVTAYYDLKNAVDQVVRTENLLERTMDYENWGPYMQENMKLLASKDYVSDMEKTLKELREMKTMIRSSTMSADAKRDAITQIGQMENALTANIQQLKKMFRE